MWVEKVNRSNLDCLRYLLDIPKELSNKQLDRWAWSLEKRSKLAT